MCRCWSGGHVMTLTRWKGSTKGGDARGNPQARPRPRSEYHHTTLPPPPFTDRGQTLRGSRCNRSEGSVPATVCLAYLLHYISTFSSLDRIQPLVPTTPTINRYLPLFLPPPSLFPAPQATKKRRIHSTGSVPEKTSKAGPPTYRPVPGTETPTRLISRLRRLTLPPLR